MGIVYKALQESEPQYLANKLHMITGERMTSYNNSNTKLLQVTFNKKETQGERAFSTGPISEKILNPLHQRSRKPSKM